MKRAKFFFLLFFLAGGMRAQEHKAHAFFLEAGGSAGLYSVNYDHEFFIREKYRLTYRAGFSYFPNSAFGNVADIIFPTLVNFLYGKKNNFFELGAGQTLQRAGGEFYTEAVLNAGYRFQKEA